METVVCQPPECFDCIRHSTIVHHSCGILPKNVNEYVYFIMIGVSTFILHHLIYTLLFTIPQNIEIQYLTTRINELMRINNGEKEKDDEGDSLPDLISQEEADLEDNESLPPLIPVKQDDNSLLPLIPVKQEVDSLPPLIKEDNDSLPPLVPLANPAIPSEENVLQMLRKIEDETAERNKLRKEINEFIKHDNAPLTFKTIKHGDVEFWISSENKVYSMAWNHGSGDCVGEFLGIWDEKTCSIVKSADSNQEELKKSSD